ncbi:MAG: hypothetical protein NT154_01485 [Verrucomicrobia bacterium]|nr:hypothetical protein [Verrucomicrobiota bacterium]
MSKDRPAVMRTMRAATGCLGLLLLMLLVWRLTGEGLNLRQRFGKSYSLEGAPLLDSFSKPSVGVGVIKLEAERLLLAFYQHRDEVESAPSALSHESTAAGRQAGPVSEGNSRAAFDPQSTPEGSALERLARLQAEVGNLEVDLDLKLVWAYYRSHSCNEFLDCYLRLVQQPSGLPWVQFWRHNALDCARKCGRAAELADALRHVANFRPNLQRTREMKAVLEMRAVLENWEADRSPSLEVSEP